MLLLLPTYDDLSPAPGAPFNDSYSNLSESQKRTVESINTKPYMYYLDFGSTITGYVRFWMWPANNNRYTAAYMTGNHVSQVTITRYGTDVNSIFLQSSVTRFTSGQSPLNGIWDVRSSSHPGGTGTRREGYYYGVYTYPEEGGVGGGIMPIYNSLEEILLEADALFPGALPITYNLTNCTAPSAPTEASSGSLVTVPFVFPTGYSIVNNSDVFVTNNGSPVPSTYSDGTLTFTMP